MRIRHLDRRTDEQLKQTDGSQDAQERTAEHKYVVGLRKSGLSPLEYWREKVIKHPGPMDLWDAIVRQMKKPIHM